MTDEYTAAIKVLTEELDEQYDTITHLTERIMALENALRGVGYATKFFLLRDEQERRWAEKSLEEPT